MAEIHEGGCLCGVVRYRVTGDPTIAGVCHCNRCKRMTGSAFSIATYFDEAAVQISGELKTYEGRSDESNRWFKLEFCPNCGTPLTWTAEFIPSLRGIAGGTFDDPNWLKAPDHYWTRSALHWMLIPAGVEIFKTTDPKYVTSVKPS
jgi:hypothetical protein